MTKFRKSHSKSDRGDSWFARVVIFTTLLIFAAIAAAFYLPSFFSNKANSHSNSYSQESNEVDRSGLTPAFHREFLPVSSNKAIIHHDYYSLAYNEEYEQADWVAYELTGKRLNGKRVPRAKRFNSDPKVKTKSAVHKDYSHSGYTRGHMAPAGDMGFSSDAMKQCFYMSNMSPQLRQCNNGIWKELEETVREWARKKGSVYIATGPMFYDNGTPTIGKNDVAVPDAFYKIILEKGTDKSVSFIIPNELSNKHLKEYQVSINDVEEQTGINFFPSLLDEEAESEKEIKYWPISDKKYRERVNNWNKQK